LGWMFNGANAFNQDIGGWDVSKAKNMNNMFTTAYDFNKDIGGWDVSSVTNMNGMFWAAKSFNQDIVSWNVSKVTDMSNMFEGAESFNQKIDQWNISNISNMENIFNDCGIDCSNYSAILIGWSNIPNLPKNIRLGANNSKYGINAECARNVMIKNGWTITGDAPSGSVCGIENSSMIYTANVTPTSSISATAEGMICSEVSSIISRGFVWSTTQNPTIENNLWIKIAGTVTGNFMSEITGLTPNTLYYLRAFAKTSSETTYGSQANFITFTKGSSDDFVTQWKLSADQTTLKFYCERSGNVTYTWETAPAGQSGGGTFTVGNGPVEITGLPSGQTISLRIAPVNFKRIYNPYDYNLSPDREKLMLIEQWGTGQWTSMVSAFWGCKYLQIIATDIPNLTNVVSVEDMFCRCSVLNGPSNINDWDVSKITDMSGMFRDASSFNQNIGSWNISSVTDMNCMFTTAKAFNQNISKWDVSKVININSIFSDASSFNQDIGNWNVSSVTDMGSAFAGAGTFNQYIGNWDVSSVTNMESMFFNASAFNQNIGKWNLSGTPNMENMLDNCGMDCFNYSATTTGWSENPSTPDSLTLGAERLQFGNSAEDARANLTTTKKWTINGDAATGTTCDLKTNLIGNKISNSNLKLYPNPVSDELTIEIESNSENFDFKIINATGQTVFNGNVIDKITVQTGSFAPGVYLVRFENDTTLEFKKIIVK